MRFNQMKMGRSFLAALIVLLAGGVAQATVNYGDFVGTNVTFNQVRETSTFGDPEPLFDVPTVTGDQLLFFPPNFTASAAGGGFDQTGALLLTDIAANGPTDSLDILRISEFGDNLLTGVGTAATGTFVSMSGFVTVTETAGGVIAPLVIGFTGTFTQDLFALPGDLGTKLWSGTVEVDIEQALIDAGFTGLDTKAIKATLSFDNDLTAFSEAGTSAKIQKKVVDGPAIIIEIIPEPATGALMGLGLLGLSALGRRRQR
jgi:hypothetical protein